MKKIKIIVPVLSFLVATALFSCANKSEQPESEYYTISIANAHKSPEVLIEGSNLVKKGDACDMFIRVEQFTYLEEIEGYEPEIVRICQANRIGYDIALDKSCYTFEKVEEDPCLYHLHINKEYMIMSYVVDIRSEYVEAYNEEGAITFPDTGSELNKDNANITVVNTSVNNDLTFFITPKYFQSGYTFNGVTKDAIKIVGVRESGDREVIPQEVFTLNELVPCDSPIQGLGHYPTSAKQLRIAIPMERLFEPDAGSSYGYKRSYKTIEISSTEGVAYDYEEKNYEKLFYPTVDEVSCAFNSGIINFDQEDDSVHYIAKFTPKSGYNFPTSFTEKNFPITDLTVLPNIYVPTGHSLFRVFEVHSDPSKQGAIKTSPFKAYIGGNGTLSLSSAHVLGDNIGNIYVPMGYDSATSTNNYWLNVKVESDGSLTIDINITDMVKYIEFPTSTTIEEFDLIEYGDEFYKFYQDGSIDFIQSFNFAVKATPNQ